MQLTWSICASRSTAAARNVIGSSIKRLVVLTSHIERVELALVHFLSIGLAGHGGLLLILELFESHLRHKACCCV